MVAQFLRYGVGYRLTVVKGADCNVVATSTLVYKHVPDAKMVSDVGAELAFVLPSQSSAGFEPLFRELEGKLMVVVMVRVMMVVMMVMMMVVMMMMMGGGGGGDDGGDDDGNDNDGNADNVGGEDGDCCDGGDWVSCDNYVDSSIFVFFPHDGSCRRQREIRRQ